MDADALNKVGQTLFGDRWQTALTRMLNLTDTKRVRQWLVDSNVPPHVVVILIALLRQRATEATALADKLEAELKQTKK